MNDKEIDPTEEASALADTVDRHLCLLTRERQYEVVSLKEVL